MQICSILICYAKIIHCSSTKSLSLLPVVILMYMYISLCIHWWSLLLYPASPSPVPHSLTTAEDKYRSPSSHHPASVPSPGSAPGHTHSHASEMAERQTLERLLRSILDRLVRHMSAVNDLVQSGHLSLLFGAISRPCPVYNKMWRKAAADCLIAICRYSVRAGAVES